MCNEFLDIVLKMYEKTCHQLSSSICDIFMTFFGAAVTLGEFCPTFGPEQFLVNTLKIGCLWRWFTNTWSWTGQNYIVGTFKPSLQLSVSESRSTQFLLTPAFCSSFPHSLPPTHHFVKLTMACHFRPCHNSSLHLLPLWILHSSSLSVLLSSLPCLSAAACLFLSAYLLCDLYILDSFPTPAWSPVSVFGSHPTFKTWHCNDILEKPALKDILWNIEVATLMENDEEYRRTNTSNRDNWCFVGTQLFENHAFSCQAVRNAKHLGKFQVEGWQIV